MKRGKTGGRRDGLTWEVHGDEKNKLDDGDEVEKRREELR